MLADEAIVGFHGVVNEVNYSNNNSISTFLHSLPLACLALTWTI